MIEKIKFWAQKVLPLVYDDSLSYYEVLSKLTHKINEVIEYCTQLSEYVKNYFKNLDVSKEVNAKLEEMAEQGEFQEYLDAYMLKGKKCVFFGDSLTWGDSGDSSHSQVDYPYPKIIAEKAGCESINVGSKGATLTVVSGSTNNLKRQIENTDLEGVDYAFMCFGVNDFNKNVAIGSTDSEDWGCIYGALYNAIRAINTKNNSVEIVIIGAPPTRHILNRKGNSWSCNMVAYYEAIGNFCLNNNIRYIDLLHNSGIDILNHAQYSSDGTHLTQSGYYLLAECILYNLGGNTPFIYNGENVWNNMQYPSSQTVGNYSIIKNGTTEGFNSWNEITINPGLYVLEFDYYSDCSVYNMSDGFVGIHFKLGDNYIVSPIGIVGGSHNIRVMFRQDEIATGVLLLRPTIQSTVEVTLNNLSINNVKLIPISGSVVYNEAVNITSEVLNGTATITRYECGIINVTINGTLVSDVARYGTIINTSALRKCTDISTQYYFAMYIDGELVRGQVINNSFAVYKDLTAGAKINFTISY